ncbi:hypothetical protein COCVIDRAFT_108986 [Bipolaris victoriae FI3]|uniref:Amidohydrolase-related domain-containing protein n=1 Tax=Bipolaris victoriae (strain FI3) TaxID=930091 RepID=W7EBN1_BIPV3|nr:hypothetical protein COCVIDRAFT_108986 [Bipolaris victoriae FI3]
MSQPHQRILDSHIHLWPSTATSSSEHGWMTPNNPLAKRHGISDYLSIASSPPPTGFIYVETDRYLPSPIPSDISSSPSSEKEIEEAKQKLSQWAAQPLEEIKFLRRIAEAKPDDGDGFTPQEADKMLGCVVYGPLHLSPVLFRIYLELAEQTAGPKLWSKVVGFRYLLQGKGDGVVQRMLQENEESWVNNLSVLRRGNSGKGWAFDVGVDINRDGTGPMEAVGKLIARVRQEEKKEGVEEGKGVRFVLNHLAKHPLSPSAPIPSPIWLSSISSLSSDPCVSMKFSGALNEFIDTPSTPSDLLTLVKTLSPFFNHVFQSFGARRILFGSDWPVCNVGGPNGESGNWSLWREVVQGCLEAKGLSEEEKESVWWGAGCAAYALDV